MLQNLPWNVQQEILKCLSPWDLLNLANSHFIYKNIVSNFHKQFRILKKEKDLVTAKIQVEIERNGRIEYYERLYTHDIHKAKIHLIGDFVNENLCFCRDDENLVKRLDHDFSILQSNASIEQIDETSLRELEETRFFVKHLYNPLFRTQDELIKVLNATFATELSLLKGEIFWWENEVAECFFAQSKIQSLNYLNLHCRPDWLTLLEKCQADKLYLRIFMDNFMDQLKDKLMKIKIFIEGKVLKWSQFEASIDTIHVHLIFEGVRERGVRNALQRELMKIAMSVLEKYDSAMIDRELGERVHLIRRRDGQGLIILLDDLSISLITCDYEFRRKRRANHGKVVSEQLESISQLMQRIYRYEIENYNCSYFESVQDREIRIFSMIECEKKLGEECLKFQKMIQGVPQRELAIDSIWYNEKFVFLPYVIGPFMHDPIEKEWPNHPLWDSHLRAAADFAQSFAETRNMNDLMEFIPY
ncbi:unnamed protein product, partial [Mesorhabditis belari]|uniref:F-box domain-containing protein n=1 Tax=Mesorhabditis belari TaxID=2138241 RepID=A0AAF3J7F8_9BILA